ncbi:hypothetical protein SAMN05443253_107130 [Bacillus sp. OK048]|nr:hypothetical protein SAMN05443253_107130 [Bacillus sp. OK048]
MTEIRKKEGKWSPREGLDARNPEKGMKVVTINLVEYKLYFVDFSERGKRK